MTDPQAHSPPAPDYGALYSHHSLECTQDGMGRIKADLSGMRISCRVHAKIWAVQNESNHVGLDTQCQGLLYLPVSALLEQTRRIVLIRVESHFPGNEFVPRDDVVVKPERVLVRRCSKVLSIFTSFVLNKRCKPAQDSVTTVAALLREYTLENVKRRNGECKVGRVICKSGSLVGNG